MQIDSFMELPKDKRPPEDIWDYPKKLDKWFDEMYGTNKKTGIEFDVDEVEG